MNNPSTSESDEFHQNSQSPQPSIPTSSSQEEAAQIIPEPLSFTKPQDGTHPNSYSGKSPPPLSKEEKNVFGGCAIIITTLISAVVLYFISRDLLLGWLFSVIAIGGSYAIFQAKKKKLVAAGAGVFIAAISFPLLDTIIPDGNTVSESDLKTPAIALEKLVKKSFSSEEGIQSINISKIEYEEGRYSLDVVYHAQSQFTEKSTLSIIRLRMEQAYQEILKHKELKIHFIRFTAQIEMQDRYGNQNGWTNVYRTVVDRKTIDKLNREKLDIVNFQEIWDETYVHRIFSPYVNEH